MEGNQVGKTDADAPTQAADFDADALLWPDFDPTPNNSSVDSSPLTVSNSDDELVWPRESSAPLAKRQSKPALVLAVLTFIFAVLCAFAIGPMQLILLAFTQDYDFVITAYYPTALRLTLLVSGFFMIANIAALVLSFRSSKHQAALIASLCTGSLGLFAIAWFTAFVAELQPNQLAIIALSLILVFWFAALMVSKTFFTTTQPNQGLKVFLAILILCSGVGIIFDGIYIFSKTAPETPAVNLSELLQNENDARLEGIPIQLGKFAFALCEGPYDAVFYHPEQSHSGLFECQESHEVYSVSDPEISQDHSRFAEATYLGQTYNPIVENYFPGATYLYRDLSGAELDLPNELILLLPSESEETLIDQNLSAFTALAAAEPNLNLSIFYTNPLDTELSTRDYILTTAVGTLALVDWLPHGNVFIGADTPDEALRYSFTLDHTLLALQTLGLDPSAYSEQVRDAITNRRHLQINTAILNLSDESTFRDQLFTGFVDPA